MNSTPHHEPRFAFWKSPWAPFAVGLFAIGILVFIRFLNDRHATNRITGDVPQTSDHPRNVSYETSRAKIRAVFEGHGLSVVPSRSGPGRSEIWNVTLPADVPVPVIHLAVQEALAGTGWSIRFSQNPSDQDKALLAVETDDTVFFSVRLIRRESLVRETGRIVLIIDDFGDHWNDRTRAFFELGVEITASVLPGRRLSRQTALEVSRLGFDVLLHLPMEPLDDRFPKNEYTILAGMDRLRIRRVIRMSCDDIPMAVGVNNHMGSKVTADSGTMRIVMEEIRAKGFFFLDSRTTPNTVAQGMAVSMGVRNVRRDVFLDTEKNKAAIRNRLYELVDKAKTRGYAVGIGHCEQETLEVLREEIPKIRQRGFVWIRLSELIRDIE